jgi:hypothetical protein
MLTTILRQMYCGNLREMICQSWKRPVARNSMRQSSARVQNEGFRRVRKVRRHVFHRLVINPDIEVLRARQGLGRSRHGALPMAMLRGLQPARALPALMRGPVLARALLRFALNCRSVVMAGWDQDGSLSGFAPSLSVRSPAPSR